MVIGREAGWNSVKMEVEEKKIGGERDEERKGGEAIHLRPTDVEWHITGLMCN